jgi:hypothetical protein
LLSSTSAASPCALIAWHRREEVSGALTKALTSGGLDVLLGRRGWKKHDGHTPTIMALPEDS